ncbi:MAG: PAS domain S-box protein [Deltaproteobacteria bacterium]|nr:PAS domain S-box protein [Deltaproteobacteria bacterium]
MSVTDKEQPETGDSDLVTKDPKPVARTPEPEIRDEALDTEYKKAEKARIESEKRYRAILDNIEEAYYETDQRGNLTFFNESLCRMIGYTRAELLGMNNRQFMEPGMARQVYRSFNQVYTTGAPSRSVDWVLIKKDGEKCVVEASVSLIKGPDGQPVGFRGIIRDLTHHKRTRAALRSIEEKNRTILDSNPDPVVVYDREGRVTYFNPAFARTFGWTLGDKLGRRLDEFVPKENWPETLMMINKVKAGQSFSGIESRRLTNWGEIIPVSISGAVHTDDQGQIIGSVINLRDISEHKKLEAQLFQSQKMEAIGRLAGGLAHELKNRMFVITGYSQLLSGFLDELATHRLDDRLNRVREDLLNVIPEIKKREGQGDSPITNTLAGLAADLDDIERDLSKNLAETIAEGRDGLGEITASVELSVELINRLLNFSFEEMLKLIDVDLNEVIENIVKILKLTIGEDIVIETRLARDLAPVRADKSLIEQVIMNMAINSRDAMRRKETGLKQLIISTENAVTSKKGIPGLLEPDQGFVCLSVSDRGEGMSPEIIPHIFDPFYTTKGFEGTGLGLSVIYGIVKQHRGWIDVESKPGQGTTFKVYLPMAAPTPVLPDRRMII